MEFYYQIMTMLPMIVFFIGLGMWLWPSKKFKGASFRQIIGILVASLALLAWTGSLAVKHQNRLFYESSKGPVYKLFEIKDKKVDTISVSVMHDTITIYVKDSTNTSVVNTVTSGGGNDSIISIPFTKANSGHMRIKIKIGPTEFDAMYDTGFDGFISFDAKTYYKLVGAGVVEEDKFVGTTDYVIGDGSVITENNFILSHVEIGDFSIDNVKVGVGDGDMILVGNHMFSNCKSYSIDQENNKIILMR